MSHTTSTDAKEEGRRAASPSCCWFSCQVRVAGTSGAALAPPLALVPFLRGVQGWNERPVTLPGASVVVSELDRPLDHQSAAGRSWVAILLSPYTDETRKTPSQSWPGLLLWPRYSCVVHSMANRRLLRRFCHLASDTPVSLGKWLTGS